MRLRAIWSCLFFGLMPWQLYERTCHYKGMSYTMHLTYNLRYALDWVCFRETDAEREFEKEVNPTWLWRKRR